MRPNFICWYRIADYLSDVTITQKGSCVMVEGVAMKRRQSTRKSSTILRQRDMSIHRRSPSRYLVAKLEQPFQGVARQRIRKRSGSIHVQVIRARSENVVLGF